MAEQTQETQAITEPAQTEVPTQESQAQEVPSEESLMKETLLDDGKEGSPEAGEAGEESKEEEKPQEQAPETYAAFKDLNGNEYAPESVQQFAEAAKKVGLSQEKAQQLFEAMVPTAREHMMNDLRTKAQQWALDCEKDPEIGGANFGANKAVAIAGYRQFATPELRTILNASGLGNHPEVVRHFYRLGKTMQQDNGVHGGASAAPQKRRRYPNSNMVVDE